MADFCFCKVPDTAKTEELFIGLLYANRMFLICKTFV